MQQLLLWKSIKYYTALVCVFVALGIQLKNAHAPYCHLWPALLYNIFPYFLINGMIAEKLFLNIKFVF